MSPRRGNSWTRLRRLNPERSERGARLMKIATWLLLFLLIFGIFSTQRTVRRSRSEEERFFAIRISAFTWLVGLIFLLALIFLPNRQRVLLMIPIFFTAVSLGKLWRNGRARIERERVEREQLGRMKRIN